MKFIRDNALRIERTVRNETHSNSRGPEADWRANAAGRGDQMADMRRVSDSGTRDHCEVLSSLDRRAGFPPLDRRGGVAWRSYDPLKETPDLFLKLARLYQEPN